MQKFADLKDINERDLSGYAGQPPRFSWPNGAKIALSFVVNYEEGGENTPANGDTHSEVFLNETPGSAPRPSRDPNMETQYEYGTRSGVYRLLSLFRRHGYKFTCFAVGRAVELTPEPVAQMHREGHEICSHNHRWIDYAKLTEEEERSHCRKAVEAIRKATGSAPRGWYTGRIGTASRRVVVEEYKKMGLELVYDSDAYNDDLPYWVKADGEPHLVVPYTLDQNDMKYAVAPGFTSPDGFYTYLKDAFDILYAEGQEGTPKMMSIGLHCRIVGKPGRAAALQRFLEYVKGHEGVWVATREEIARFWKKEFPLLK
ncbi:hypothetical protein HKX48_002446 [Thoreauomyces humboldtii]|nr:hypothetical protein HKX48_002446 [Thoreauomyces humboldtii]